MPAIPANAASEETSEPGKGLNIALWILAGLLAFAFIGAGIAKLTGQAAMVTLYDTIGIGHWFRHLTGLIEVAAGVLVLVPRTRVIGAAIMVCTMVGALVTQLFLVHDTVVPVLVLLTLASALLWARRLELMKLFAR